MADETTGRGAGHDYPRPALAWYGVLVLMGAYVLSFADRTIIGLLVGPIRRDLGISDTEVSLLMGLTFALFYTVFGIPLGRLADTGSRVRLIGAGVVFWSLMTALCGTARGYGALLLFRMGVGVGEAALSPAAYSILADTFPPERRSSAISVYSTGIYVGAGLAGLLGGGVVHYASGPGRLTLPFLGEVAPWRAVFLILGAAGLLFSLLLLTLREPRRRETGMAGRRGAVPLRAVLAHLRKHRATFCAHAGGFALLAFAGYGAAAWIPTFFVRQFGWEPARAGMAFGTVQLLAGTAGLLTGGRLADRLLSRGHSDGNLRVGLLSALAALPFALLAPAMPTPALALAGVTCFTFASGLPWGAGAAAIQQLAPNEMRGQASAVYLFVINLVGLGIGPTAVALATDQLFRSDQAVGASLQLVATAACLGAALALALGLAPFRRSVAALAEARRAP